jgi:IclR family transcriptional regulator, KDG regulon repressor
MKVNMKDPTEYNVRAVERALQILNSFDDQHPERGLSEIAQFVELHKATAHRIITTLVNYGYLERGSDGQKYKLGLQLTDLGFKAIHRLDLRREAIPYMNQLIQKLGEACDLSIFDRGEVFYIEFVQGRYTLTVAAAVGQRLPPHCTASGKVFLANFPTELIKDIIKEPLVKYTSKTITKMDSLLKTLDLVRRQGFAIDDEEMEVGIKAVSAPIRNQSGMVMAALSIPGPTSRLSDDMIQRIAGTLIETTNEISRRMGWKG